MKASKFLYWLLLIIFTTTVPLKSQEERQGSLSGQVSDQLGGVIVGAELTLINRIGERRVEVSDQNGRFRFPTVQGGSFVLRIRKSGFATYENLSLELKRDSFKTLNIILAVQEQVENVEVPLDSDKPDTDPNANKDGTVFKGNDLEALPDDPEALESALKLLAGTSVGPDGGEIFIDGFSSRNVPPKSSIHEIRINRNPFSAEFDRLGYGRIEIITKAGKTELAGSMFYRFNDDVLNARNPFALSRPPFLSNRFGGDISNSLFQKRASFFFDIDWRRIADSSIINASVLDAQFRIVPFRQNVRSSEKAIFSSTRTDFQLNPNHTLSLRYGLTAKANENVGIGDFALISQAYDISNTNQTLQLAQTSVVRQKIINELRFQYERLSRRTNAMDSAPTIAVSDSFIGGGSAIGSTDFTEGRWELSDNVTLAPEYHTIRFGLRARKNSLKDISPSNFNGTFIFAGGIAPRLENGQFVFGINGQPILENITSIERYRRTLFFGQQGFSPVAIRQRGGGPVQFSINGGNPEAVISQLSFSGYIQDDWRIRSSLGLSFGLRFETQTNIKRSFDLAPRIALAWSRQTSEKKKLTTVVRGGFGVFYSRFGENLVLDTEKFDGNHLIRFIVTDTNILDSFSSVPGVQDLNAIGQPFTPRQIAAEVRVPYSLHSALSLEQQLPLNSVLTITYSNLRVRRALRSRNINAPRAESFARPFPSLGDIYRYESSGRFNSRKLSFGLSTRLAKFGSLFMKYDLGSAKSDTDGAANFPVNQFDLSGEYGRSNLDLRHSFVLSGSINAALGIRLSPLIVAASGRPFNITLGHDSNGDSLFNDRPAFATDLNRASVIQTRFGAFDLNSLPSAATIPRNFGTSTSFFAVSLRASRNFSFNLGDGKAQAQAQAQRPMNKRFGLNLAVQFWNLFNRANLNLPIGNLTSPFFGRAISISGSFGAGDPLSGSRTIEFQARFSF